MGSHSKKKTAAVHAVWRRCCCFLFCWALCYCFLAAASLPLLTSASACKVRESSL